MRPLDSEEVVTAVRVTVVLIFLLDALSAFFSNFQLIASQRCYESTEVNLLVSVLVIKDTRDSPSPLSTEHHQKVTRGDWI